MRALLDIVDGFGDRRQLSHATAPSLWFLEAFFGCDRRWHTVSHSYESYPMRLHAAEVLYVLPAVSGLTNPSTLFVLGELLVSVGGLWKSMKCLPSITLAAISLSTPTRHTFF